MKKEKKLYAEVNGEMLAGLTGLASAAVLLVVVVIIVAFGSEIQDDVADDFTSGSVAHNISVDGQDSMRNVSGRFGLIGTLIGVSVILTFVLGFAAFKFGNQ